MSDVMLHGVLNMPPDLWRDSELDKAQRYARYQEASERIKQQEAEIKRLRKAMARARAYIIDDVVAWNVLDDALQKP